MDLKVGDRVTLVIGVETHLGYTVLIDESHEGLIYRNEIFTPVEEGQKTIGFIKNIREDGKIDVSLRPLGYRSAIHGDKEKILDKLTANGGVIKITDKSSPESIKFHMQMSKKAFKRALGALYKEKKVLLFPDRIQLKK
jgi:predicted RNA-binding protein (virulence factor B family)